MRRVLLLIAFSGLFGRITLSQPTYPALPDADYNVYTAVLNEFSDRTNDQYAYQHGELLFLNYVTQEKGKYSFRFNFAKAQEDLPFRLKPNVTFYKEPDWKTFIASVDTNQFISYEIKHPLTLTCRKTQIWTANLNEYYFGQENRRNRDFYALRNDYKNFGGIVRFSKVAYTADGQKALCYYSQTSDSRAGAGYLVFLEKSAKVWRLVGKAMLWIS